VTDEARAVINNAYVTAGVGGTTKNPYGYVDLHALRRVPIQRSDARVFFKLKLSAYLEGEERVRAYADARFRRRGAAQVGARAS
jgi:hypothetical protein